MYVTQPQSVEGVVEATESETKAELRRVYGFESLQGQNSSIRLASAAPAHASVTAMLRRAASRGLSAPAALKATLRLLNIHEYQGAELLRAAGVNVPPGIACKTAAEVATAAAKLGGASGEVVLKSQILAGGRGLGTFTSGLKGGVHIVKARGGVAESVRGQALTGFCRLRTPQPWRPRCWAARWSPSSRGRRASPCPCCWSPKRWR